VSLAVLTTTLDGRNHMATSPDIQTPDRREEPRCRSAIDCAGAQLHVHARSLATVLRIDGEIDASNADLVAQGIRRFLQLEAPLIMDLSHLDFLGIAGLRALLMLDKERHQDQLHCSVVSGAALRRLTRLITDHGLVIVDSVPEALQLIEDVIRARRQFLSGLAGQREPQRKTRPGEHSLSRNGLCRAQIGQWGPDTRPLAEEIRAAVFADEFRVHATLASPSLGEAIRGDAIMTSQNLGQTEDARLEHFDNPELGSGARDTGDDSPESGGGDRPVGTVDEDANPPTSDPTASETYGGTGELPPQDTGSAMPPYEGRKKAGA
jgi:anti-anti-sigma factor